MPRHGATITRATVRRHAAPAATATLLDLSIYGCRLAATLPVEADERLWVRLDGGLPIAASVVWVEGEEIGCRFDEPISTAQVRALTLIAC